MPEFSHESIHEKSGSSVFHYHRNEIDSDYHDEPAQSGIVDDCDLGRADGSNLALVVWCSHRFGAVAGVVAFAVAIGCGAADVAGDHCRNLVRTVSITFYNVGIDHNSSEGVHSYSSWDSDDATENNFLDAMKCSPGLAVVRCVDVGGLQ